MPPSHPHHLPVTTMGDAKHAQPRKIFVYNKERQKVIGPVVHPHRRIKRTQSRSVGAGRAGPAGADEWHCTGLTGLALLHGCPPTGSSSKRSRVATEALLHRLARGRFYHPTNTRPARGSLMVGRTTPGWRRQRTAFEAPLHLPHPTRAAGTRNTHPGHGGRG